MLKYQPITNIQELYNCCRPDDGDNNIPPTGDCCYDTWKNDLDQVAADLEIAKRCTEHKAKEYEYTNAWYQKIKVWCDDWTATDENADALCRQLELFTLHLSKVCKVTEKTGDALEILFCMAKDLYIRLDKLKEEYDEIMQCISCMKSPDLAPGTGILVYLEEYGKKLTAAIATRDDLIGKVIDALELAYAINIDLGKDFGLSKVLNYWKSIFHCANCNDDDNDCKDQGQRNIKDSNPSHPHCNLHPAISFPLDDDEYYKELHHECDDLKLRTERLKEERDRATEKSDALQACKESLELALLQVNPKNKTK